MLVAAVLVGASLGALVSPVVRKGTPLLSNQVDASTFVCIGVVDEVFAVSLTDGTASKTRQFGRIQVERVLKGDPQTKVVFHEGWGTWTCDTTSAASGRRALFLLGPGVVARASAEDRNRVAQALGSDSILRNIGSGDGIVPIHMDGEREYVVQSGWPSSMRAPELRKGMYLSDVVAWIEAMAHFSPEALAVHARCDRALSAGAGAAETFDLRILPDGSRRLARRLGMQEIVVVDRLSETRWAQLQSMLRLETGIDDRVVDPSRGRPARTLTIRLDNRRLEFRQGQDQELEDVNEADWPVLDRALRAWAAVFDVIDCPTCSDHRQADARFLAAR